MYCLTKNSNRLMKYKIYLFIFLLDNNLYLSLFCIQETKKRAQDHLHYSSSVCRNSLSDYLFQQEKKFIMP
jgi:hypothetical protein